MRNAAALLERARQTDDEIRAIHVFDATGKIVHSTAIAPPAVIPPAAAMVRKTNGGKSWNLESGDRFLSGIEIAPQSGKSSGGILIVYPAAGSITKIRAMAAELALAAIIVLVVAGAVSALLLRLGLARQIRLFAAIDHTITGFEQGAWRSAAGREPMAEDSGSRELQDLLVRAEESYRATGRMLHSPRDGEQ